MLVAIALIVYKDIIGKKIKISLQQGDSDQFALSEKKTALYQMCSNLLYYPINLKVLEVFEQTSSKGSLFLIFS